MKLDKLLDKTKSRADTHKVMRRPIEIADELRPYQNEPKYISEVDPKLIKNWEFNDRPEKELGDIQGLANDFKMIGQQQPCVVRPIQDDGFRFELIIGERRWRAAILAELKLKCIIQEMGDHEAALAQATENILRKNLSDFAKGISYAKLIDRKILSREDLENKLGINKMQVSRLLSFWRIKNEFTNIYESIENFSNVTARTASEICSLASKGQDNIEAIIKLSPLVKLGKLGSTSLRSEVDKIINNDLSDFSFEKVYSSDGRHIFSWRADGNKNISISFPRDITTLLDLKLLEINIRKDIENQFLGKLNESNK